MYSVFEEFCPFGDNTITPGWISSHASLVPRKAWEVPIRVMESISRNYIQLGRLTHLTIVING